MMTFLVFALSLLTLGSDPDLKQVEWLLGRWVTTDHQDEERSYEIWKKISDRQFQGTGYTTNGTDTSFFETLEITFEEDQFYYIADIAQNPKPTYFRITEMSDTSLVCENPEHDFPQRIEYRRRGDLLRVEISAKDKSKVFHFKKTGEENSGDR